MLICTQPEADRQTDRQTVSLGEFEGVVLSNSPDVP